MKSLGAVPAPTWNSSDFVVLPALAGNAVVCRPHAGRYGYGHTLEAIVKAALTARRAGAPLLFVPTGTPIDGLTRLESDRIRIRPWGGVAALAWRARSVRLSSGWMRPSAVLWRLVEFAKHASTDPGRTKRTRALMKRAVRFVRTRAPRRLERGKQVLRRGASVSPPRLGWDDWRELAERPLDLRLSRTAREEGERRALAAGVPAGSPLVALHVRHSGYKSAVGGEERRVDAVRAADVGSYLPALALLVRRGYAVVRLGDPASPRIDLAGVVDLAHSSERCPLLDAWVSQRCRFMIVCDSGPSLLNRLGAVPCLAVNVVDLRTAAVKPIDRFICKRPVAVDGAPMSLSATVAAGVLGASELERAEAGGRPRFNASRYAYVDNTSAEVVEAVEDMLDVLDRNPAPTGDQRSFHRMLADAGAPGFVGAGLASAPFARAHLGALAPA